jgi:hypothetical protein
MADVGTVILSEFNNTIYPVSKVKFTWESDASGAVDKITNSKFTGKILGAVISPLIEDSIPSSDYDVFLYDMNDNVDLLCGNGQNLTGASSTYIFDPSKLGVAVNAELNLYIENAGESKTGEVIIYLDNPQTSA